MAAAIAELSVQEEQIVAFTLGAEIYGADIALIHEIIRWREITPIPRTTADIEGVINLRGKIVPILDLRKRLGLPAAERTNATRIVVVELADCTVGMVVDGVVGVMRIPETQIEPPSPLIANINIDTIRGVAKADNMLIILLDMARALQQE